MSLLIVFQCPTDPSFTDWLFVEAAKGFPESELQLTSSSTSPSLSSETTSKPPATSEIPVHLPSSLSENRRPPNPRGGAPGPLYQQALSSTLGHGQKRTASVRSPSPTGHGPSKTRRMDVPTGPRAMQSGGSRGEAGASASASGRSLLDRVGGRNGSHPPYARGDEIQARIDAVTNGGIPPGGATPDPGMMMGFQNGVGIDLTAANVNANTMVLQEMMMNQMALMAQMATSMGMLNPATGQMMGGFPGMQQGDMGMYQGGGAFGQGQTPAQGMNGRGRGSGRGGRGRGGGPGRGGFIGASPAASSESPTPTQTQVQPQPTSETNPNQPLEPSVPIVAPTPTPASVQQPPPIQQRIPYALPERPQSPTLCKFGTKCTNSQCRYSHPSPVATAESGVVLSTDTCEKGRDCKDKDCIKSHVSPAVNAPGRQKFSKFSFSSFADLVLVGAETPKPSSAHPHPQTAPAYSSTPSSPIACRFGTSCTRPNCTFSHPPRPVTTHFDQQCRFGAACTRASCPFQHPDGRVLPTSFHRGLSTNGPLVNVPNPETGSMGGSVHRSMTFNVANKGTGTTDNVKEKLERQIKELEATKKAVQDAEAAAAAGKKNETKSTVPIAA